MQKNNRRLILLLLSVLILSLGSVKNAYASNASLYYIASCPDSTDGKHHMNGRSTCWAKNINTNKTRTGQGGQCRYCHLLIVTQNNLFLYPYQGMGWYATRSAWADEGNSFTIEVTSFSTNNSYTDSVGQQFVWE